ncbi:outer membrane lipoprotein chaperone LolA [candidate division KSB1 bacterium]|nr:outer membrane lipoprotein chaperone LolA [candidate division KSB1 bacterium]
MKDFIAQFFHDVPPKSHRALPNIVIQKKIFSALAQWFRSKRFLLNDKLKWGASALLFILTIVPAQETLAQENANKILSKVRSTYDALESLSADFEKEYTWALAGETQALSGKLYLKKGDRYRIETEMQTIVTDGKTVWTYSPEKAQVFVDNMEKSKENPLPRDLLVKYTSDFKAQYLRSDQLGEVECHVLLLTAREEEAFAQTVTVWVDKKTSVALQIEQRDLNDNITVYRLQNLALNAKLADQLFTFTAPNDTEVIDLRK